MERRGEKMKGNGKMRVPRRFWFLLLRMVRLAGPREQQARPSKTLTGRDEAHRRPVVFLFLIYFFPPHRFLLLRFDTAQIPNIPDVKMS